MLTYVTITFVLLSLATGLGAMCTGARRAESVLAAVSILASAAALVLLALAAATSAAQ